MPTLDEQDLEDDTEDMQVRMYDDYGGPCKVRMRADNQVWGTIIFHPLPCSYQRNPVDSLLARLTIYSKNFYPWADYNVWVLQDLQRCVKRYIKAILESKM